MSTFHRATLANGLELVGEPMPGKQSLAMSLLVPAGTAYEPTDQYGLGAVLSEMVLRGAGALDGRAHSEALDGLGVQRSTRVQTRFMRFGATMLGHVADDAIPLVLDMAARPMLAESTFEPSRSLALQSVQALRDEPQQWVMERLRRRHYPSPLNRSPLGEADDLKALTHRDVVAAAGDLLVPGGAILAFAGQFDWPKLCDQVEAHLADWRGQSQPLSFDAPTDGGYEHLDLQTQQVHLAIAQSTVPEPDERSTTQAVATAVLSGGMSGRLFTQVREKRGLCYAVNAAYAGHKDHGATLTYAGTTTARAQQTLDVVQQQLRLLAKGVEADELERAKIGMKSRLVMQGESTGARANAIAEDLHMIGRPRALTELAQKVDQVSLESINRYVADSPTDPMTIVTIGPSPLRPT